MIQVINSFPTPWPTIVWLLIAILGAVAVFLIIRYWKTPLVKRILYELVCRAEQAYGSNTGQIKYNAVLSWFYGKSLLLALLFPEPIVSKYIDEALKMMKSYLEATGANLLSLSDEAALKAYSDPLAAEPETEHEQYDEDTPAPGTVG